jgi:Uma2 family endonuclease
VSPPLPLESGDRLARAEFLRRYESAPDVKKAELINGVVYVSSPVSLDHSGAHFRLSYWLGRYAELHAGVEGHDNVTLVLPGNNIAQPDLLLRREAGKSRAGERRYLEGVPELIVEIAVSTSSIDLHAKRRMYERAGVPEYLVWRAADAQLDWLSLRDGKYEAIPPGDDGVVESRSFPGLRLSQPVFVQGSLADLAALLR